MEPPVVSAGYFWFGGWRLVSTWVWGGLIGWCSRVSRSGRARRRLTWRGNRVTSTREARRGSRSRARAEKARCGGGGKTRPRDISVTRVGWRNVGVRGGPGRTGVGVGRGDGVSGHVLPASVLVGAQLRLLPGRGRGARAPHRPASHAGGTPVESRGRIRNLFSGRSVSAERRGLAGATGGTRASARRVDSHHASCETLERVPAVCRGRIEGSGAHLDRLRPTRESPPVFWDLPDVDAPVPRARDALDAPRDAAARLTHEADINEVILLDDPLVCGARLLWPPELPCRSRNS